MKWFPIWFTYSPVDNQPLTASVKIGLIIINTMFKFVALVLGLLGQNIVLADVAAQVPFTITTDSNWKKLLLIGSIQ